MKLLNKFIIISGFIAIAHNAIAYNLPPFTNHEIKQYANSLIEKQLVNSSKPYFQELAKRGDKLNSTWGFTLIDIANGNNKQALDKVNFLLKQDKVKTRTLENLQAELLINLAEESLVNSDKDNATAYLKTYFKKHNGHYNFQKRAKLLRNKINNDANTQHVNIGVILPLTGKLSHIGNKIQKALILAIYNKKLSNITLYFEDNKSTQEGSIKAAATIINKNVRMVVGPILRDNVLAANTVISNTQIPIFTFSNDESIAGNNIFLNNINIKQEAYDIAKFAADHGQKRVACLTPKNLYGETEKTSFISAIKSFNIALEGCQSFDAKNIDINKSIKKLLEINKQERKRLAELRKLEKEFEIMGNAMDDEKISRMAELAEKEEVYDINFDAVFIPTSAKKLLTIAPQLAFYDIDFSNGVQFIGPSTWDDNSILKNRGEHLHFTRFLSLKSDKFKAFAKQYKETFGKNANLLTGFAYDILEIAQDIDFRQNFYSQIYKESGFSVLTSNVKFNRNNTPQRVYGVNKISRRKIKPIITVKHLRPITMPSELNIEKTSGFGNWFKF